MWLIIFRKEILQLLVGRHGKCSQAGQFYWGASETWAWPSRRPPYETGVAVGRKDHEVMKSHVMEIGMKAGILECVL